MCHDDDMQRQQTVLTSQYAGILKPTVLPFIQPTCGAIIVNSKKAEVAFNDAFRILLKIPRWTSASHVCDNNVSHPSRLSKKIKS